MDIAVMPEHIREDGLPIWLFQLLGGVLMLDVGNGPLRDARASAGRLWDATYIANQTALIWSRIHQIIASIKRHPHRER